MTRLWTARALAVAACALGTPCGGQETVFEGEVSEALLLADGTVALVEEARLLLVRPGGRTVAVDGSFGAVTDIAHASDGGVVVWDESSYAAFVIGSDGAENRAVPFADLGPGIGSGERSFVGLSADDVGLFEEIVLGENLFAPSPGPSRNLVRYAAVGRDGSETVVWEALGDEIFVHSTSYGIRVAPVIFGYGVLAANIVGGGFAVAQTEAPEAAVLDVEGARIRTIPLPPPGPGVSRDQIEWERDRLMAMPQVPPRLENILNDILPPDQAREALAAMSTSRMEALRMAQANTVPPRISALRVDRERRVWMRRFAPPGATVAVWDVHPLSAGDGFSVDLPVAWNVFDADDGRMLVGVKEGETATRVVSARIRRWLSADRGAESRPGSKSGGPDQAHGLPETRR